MRLKTDENLGRASIEALRAAGHDVLSVYDQKLPGAADATLASVCIAERRGLVTLDMDSANPLRFRPSDTAGVAVLRMPARITAASISAVLLTLIHALESQTFEGKLWIVEAGRVREYQPET